MTPEERAAHPRRCTATARTTGERCTQFAVPGAKVCHWHGGGSPAVRAKGQQRLAEEKAEQLLGKVWDPDAAPVENVVDALLKLAGQTMHALDQLGRRLDLDDGLSGEVVPIAWRAALREARQLLVSLEQLNLEQRRVQVESARLDLMAAAYIAMVDALGLDENQRELGTRVFFRELRGEAAARPALEVVRGDVE